MRRRIQATLLGVALMLSAGAPPPARAEGLQLSGFLLSYGYMNGARAFDSLGLLSHDYQDESWFPIDRAGLRWQLRIQRQWSEYVSMDMSLNVDYAAETAARQPTSGLGDGVSVDFKEAFITLGRVLPWLDMKIGRQFIFWGRFEWGSLEDVISGWDFVNMGAEKENFRRPVDALRLWIDLAPVTIEGVVVGYAQPNRVALALPDKIGPLDVIQEDAEVPDLSLANVETGLRATVELGDAELGLTYYRGHQRNFSLGAEVVPDAQTGWPAALRFTPRYDRHQLLALDGQVIVDDSVILLAESGLFLTADEDGTDIAVKNDHARAVVGVEWEPSARFRLQAQTGMTYLLDYDRQVEYDARKALGEPDPYVPAALQFEAFYKLQWQVADDLGLHLLHLINFPDSSTFDMMVLAFVSWEPVQALKLYAGFALFHGAEATRFGRLEGDSQIFFELKHSY